MNKPSQNPKPNHSPCDESTKAKFAEYFYSNMISVSGVALFLLGGGIFIAFYANIGYMPDFDLISSITLVAAVTTTTIAMVASLVALLIFPGTIWSGSWGIKHPLSTTWSKNGQQGRLEGILLWVGLPMSSGILTVIFCLFWDWYPLPIAIIVFVSFYCFKIKRKTGLPFREILKKVGLLLVLTSLSSLFIWFPFWVVFNLYLQTDSDLAVPAWVAALVSAIFILASNTLSVFPPTEIKKIYWHISLGTATLFFILLIFGGFHKIPAGVMKLYKLGNIQTSEIVLSNEGCSIFRTLGIGVSQKKGLLCSATDVLILSRLGRETYLRHGSGTESVKFTITSSDIVSWSILETKKSAPSEPESE